MMFFYRRMEPRLRMKAMVVRHHWRAEGYVATRVALCHETRVNR
jgi:hypothetical protein